MTLYYHPARGDGKSLLTLVNTCKAMGLTYEEIQGLFDKAIEKMEGAGNGSVE